jgi:thiamine pyrophosphokinase
MRAIILAGGSLGMPAATEGGLPAAPGLTVDRARLFGSVPPAEVLVVAADGGVRHAAELGLNVALVLGDMDSADPDDLRILAADGVEVVRYPRRKDATDLELALNHVHRQGVDEVVIVGAFGGRWDLSFANALLPTRVEYTGMRIRCLAATWSADWLRGPGAVDLDGSVGAGVSLIPLGGDVGGVVTRGLEYSLSNATLRAGSTRGVSNTIASHPATVGVQSGHLLCITTPLF